MASNLSKVLAVKKIKKRISNSTTLKRISNKIKKIPLQ